MYSVHFGFEVGLTSLYNTVQNLQVDVVKEEVDTLVKPLLEKEESEKEIQVEENEGTDQSKANWRSHG